MNEGAFYVLSNACIDTFPSNTRSKYSNTLSKQLNVKHTSVNSLWLALDSLTIQNSIVQYKNNDDLYDMLAVNTGIGFSMSEKWFESSQSFLNFLSSKRVGKFFTEVNLVNGFIILKTNGRYTVISKRFYRYLGFTNVENERVLGNKFLDGRMKDYYGKYYIMDLGGENNLLRGDHPFDVNIFTPNLMKIISPDIAPYVCGGSYKNILAVVPLDHSSSSITFIPAITKFFRASCDCVTNISVELLDENDLPINFTTGPPTIAKLQFKENMNDVNNNTFYVQISNNDSVHVFPRNSSSSFKSKLPKCINIKGRWVIALASIYIPPYIKNFVCSSYEYFTVL